MDDIITEVSRELLLRQRSLAVAESCTGGLLGATITAPSGASAYFRGGVIAYQNDVKQNLLKVRGEALRNVGAVSEPVAQQMALGVRAALGADYGIGITGVAGPTGGTPEKPVGLVFICVSSEAGDLVEAFHFDGDREEIRQAAVAASLRILHQKLLSETP